jgi:hypothetical protein
MVNERFHGSGDCRSIGPVWSGFGIRPVETLGFGDGQRGAVF